MCIIFLFTNICSPHQLFLQVLYERVFLAAYYKLSVAGFAHRYGHIFIATFVTSVYGYKEIVAAAGNFYINSGIVINYNGTCAKAMRCNGGKHQNIGFG